MSGSGSGCEKQREILVELKRQKHSGIPGRRRERIVQCGCGSDLLVEELNIAHFKALSGQPRLNATGEYCGNLRSGEKKSRANAEDRCRSRHEFTRLLLGQNQMFFAGDQCRSVVRFKR